MVRIAHTNSGFAGVCPLACSITAEDLYDALHKEDESWVLTPPEDDTQEEAPYLLTKGDAPGYQFLADDKRGYLVDNYSGYHFSSSQLDDFIEFIAHSERIAEELLDQAVSLKSSKLNAAEDKSFDPVDVAKQILIIARDRAQVDGLEKCTWGRPTAVDRNKVMVKRKPGETDAEMEARRKKKSEWLGDEEADVVVTQTLFMEKEWVTKMALQLVFEGEGSSATEERRVRGADGKSTMTSVTGTKRELTAVFIPNHDPERAKAGVGVTEKSAGQNSIGSLKDRVFQKEFTIVDTGNIASDYREVIFWTAQQLYDAIKDVFKHPPKRLVKRMFENGLIKIKPTKRTLKDGTVVETIIDDDSAYQWLKALPKTSSFELVREGYVPGRDVLSTHPEWATAMLNEGLVEPEEVLRIKNNDPNSLYNMVKKGQLPAEKAVALAKDDKLTARLIKDGLYSPRTGDESTDVNELVQQVAEGKISPGKAWEINKNSVDAMLEAGVITPKEAYHLNPNGLANLMRKGYIGKAEGQKLSPQIKRRFTKEEWDNLKASLSVIRQGRHLNACTASNFEACVGDCDDVTTINTLERIGEFESNPFNEQSPAEWFNSLDDDAKNIVFSLVMTWLIGDGGVADSIGAEPIETYTL